MKTTREITVIAGPFSLPAGAAPEEILEAGRRFLRRTGLVSQIRKVALHKRSVDARRRDCVKYVCSVMAEIETGADPAALTAAGLRPADAGFFTPVFGQEKADGRILVVGCGPAGLFAALLLAENGYAPLLIERGGSVQERVESVRRFYSDGRLDEDCNIQFGAGGAGTFSDGKLVTRISDPKCSYVLRRFAEFGAPEEIRYLAKPHIGTDRLRGVVENICNRIAALGGEIRFRCKLESFSPDGRIARTSQGDIPCAAAILAVGHSARDTYRMLLKSGFPIEAKAFSAGVRIEHLQEKIDRAMYGNFAGTEGLGHGEYALSRRYGARGVYTFCMCPGGQVVAAASEEGGVVVNGMSEYARNGKNANSAVAVSVLPEDFGGTPEGAMAFQRQMEAAAFAAGGSNYNAPCQRVGDFLAGKRGGASRTVLPSYRDGRVTYTDLNAILPDFIASHLKEGIRAFDREISGFSDPDALLTGVETRTSAPLRILRGEDRTSPGHPFLYPCGEGAGYAGGITSAAVDGINTALAVMARFAPKN